MFKRTHRIIAIDFGSEQIRVVIGDQTSDGSISVSGYGSSESKGIISKGTLQNMDAGRRALRSALKQAYQKTHKTPPQLVAIGVNTPQAETHIEEGFIRLQNEEINEQHIYQLFQSVQRQIKQTNKEMLTPINSYEWFIDNINVANPLGMRAHQLKIRMHFTLIPSVILNNLRSCVENELNLSYNTYDCFIYHPIATALSALTYEDKELGALVIDLGRTTTNVALYFENRLMYANTFDFGTIYLPRDLSAIFKISYDEATRIIYEYGIPTSSPHSTNPFTPSSEVKTEHSSNPVLLQSVIGDTAKNVPKNKLESAIYERAREIIHTIYKEIEKRQLNDKFLRGVVLTGGGARIKNLDQLVRQIFNTDVRIGKPLDIEKLPQPIDTPEFTTVLGILKSGDMYYQSRQRNYSFLNRRILSRVLKSLFPKTLSPLYKKERG